MPSTKCKKSTVAVAEKKNHDGKPCKKGEERTANYCVKPMSPYKKKAVKWVRTISPNKKTLITIVCPK